MKCTIKQLAEELGLSRNTVAKALKNSSDVSDKTKQIVLAKAKELNYKKLYTALAFQQKWKMYLLDLQLQDMN